MSLRGRLRLALLVALGAGAPLVACSNSGSPVSPIGAVGVPPAPSGGGTGTPTAGPTHAASGVPTTLPTATATSPSTPVPTGAATSSAVGPAESKLGTYAAINAFYQTLPHTSAASDAQSLVTFMSARPEFASVTQTDLGVSSRFTDGTEYSISLDNLSDIAPIPAAVPFDRSRAGVSPAAAVAKRASAVFPQASSATMPDLPGSSVAYVFYPPAELPQSKTAADQISDALTKIGYTVHELPATVANLIAVKNAAVFVLLSHSTIQDGPDGLPHGALVTGVANNDADQATYANDFKNGDLVLSGTQTFAGISLEIPRIAFTGKFVHDHLGGAFAKNAIVVVNACFSDSPTPAFTDLVSNFTAFGVQYYGWTKEVAMSDAVQTEQALLDRLIGEQYPSMLTTAVGQETPPQKAFDVPSVFKWLVQTSRPGASTTLDESSGDGNNATRQPITGSPIDAFAFFRLDPGSPDADVMLAPSLNSVYTYTPDLTSTFATGNFGSSGGTFMLDPGSGSPSAIGSTQSSSTIVTGVQAILQTSAGAAGAGYFSFVASNGVKSNVVAFTNYTGTLTYSNAFSSSASWTTALDGSPCPGGSWTGSANGGEIFPVDARIDLEGSRTAPGENVPAGAQAGGGGPFDMASMPALPTISGSGKGMTQYDASSGSGPVQCKSFAQVGTANGSGVTPIDSATLSAGGKPVWNGGLSVPQSSGQTAPATISLNIAGLVFGQYQGDVFAPSSSPQTDDQNSQPFTDFGEMFRMPTTFDETAYTFAPGSYKMSVPQTKNDGTFMQNSTTMKEVDFQFGGPTLLPRSTDAR